MSIAAVLQQVAATALVLSREIGAHVTKLPPLSQACL